ncbi:MAG: MBL fold metallo-hydrolase [Desulfobulbaceae bacterium]|nr:MBL fold metallo-hydrolase [Desulfobulbaceae bacterium]HIJ77714.1 MBL fold metallo-hydrolase [Deltaproteobacteria bacterium]
MRFCVLGSGSKGNSTFVEAGQTRVLIDAGFSGKEIERRLAAIKVEAASLTAILITHEHSDHTRGAAILSRRFKLPILVNALTRAASGETLGKPHALQEFVTGASFTCGELAIHPFRLSHDAADPVGFVVSCGLTSMGYCTDTGVVSRLMHHRLATCNGLVLESNHDPEMLRNGPYPLYLQQRVRSKEGHLANEEAAQFLGEIMHQGLEHVVLSHLSETNNKPELADAVVKAVVAHHCRAENSGWSGPVISVAAQDQVGEVITLAGGDGDGRS